MTPMTNIPQRDNQVVKVIKRKPKTTRVETTEQFIKRLSEGDDDYLDQSFDDSSSFPPDIDYTTQS
jgi:hypothetical protein